jgi:hypothetical protein
MTWVRGPRSTFGLPTFEKRDHRRVVGHSKIRPLMSAMGQKRTLTRAQPMSALPPKADIRRHELNVRFVPQEFQIANGYS